MGCAPWEETYVFPVDRQFNLTTDTSTDYHALVGRHLPSLLINASTENQPAFRPSLLPAETLPIRMNSLADGTETILNRIGESLSCNCMSLENRLMPTANVAAYSHSQNALQYRRSARTREQLVL